MRHSVSILVLTLLVTGCRDSSTPPARTPPADPNAAQAVVAAHPILAGLAGSWGEAGQVVVRIVPQPDGSALLQVPQPSEGWRIEVRNARAQSGKILYEQYHYAVDAPTHRFDGARCDVILEPMPAMRDKARLTVTSEDAETEVRTLSRIQ